MTTKGFRLLKKFAYGDEVHIAMSSSVLVEEYVMDNGPRRTLTGNTIHLLTFHQCADHLRNEICDLLGADKTFLGKNEEQL